MSTALTSSNVQFFEPSMEECRSSYKRLLPSSAISSDIPLMDEYTDSSVFPGLKNPEKAIKELRLREKLKKLITSFSQEGLAWSLDEDDLKISSATEKASKAFFECLPIGYVLPKISPDGDGALILVWEEQESPIILIIDEWKCHLIKAAATENSEHIKNIPFEGEKIPNQILDVLPHKSLV